MKDKKVTKNENLSQLIERLAPSLGARVFMEPRYKRYGVIIFNNGKRLYFKYNRVNVNTSSTVMMTTNKHETSFFLRKFGYKVPDGQTFSYHPYDIKNKHSYKEALEYARKLGFPVIMKPNNKSQGTLVCKVHNEQEFKTIARKILKTKEDILLVERYYGAYSDYRIVVLQNEVISVYQRLPLHVVGDGESSILELLQSKKEIFSKIGRPLKEINEEDFRIKMHLKNEGKSLDSIPLAGEKVVLLDNSNLSSGGTTIDLTQEIAQEFKDLAVSIASDLSLVMAGIDILTPDIKNYSDDYVILEVNSAPGLDNYAFVGEKQKQYVDTLYLKLLKAMEKM